MVPPEWNEGCWARRCFLRFCTRNIIAWDLAEGFEWHANLRLRIAPQGSSRVGQTSIWDLGVQNSGQGLGVGEWLSGSLGNVMSSILRWVGVLGSFSMVGLERPCKVWPPSLALGWVGSGHRVPFSQCGDGRVAVLYGPR